MSKHRTAIKRAGAVLAALGVLAGNSIMETATAQTIEEERPLYQDLCADIEEYTGHAYVPSEWHYINPTDEELASLKEVDWSAPGDYSYMVDWMDPEFRPKLFQATSSGYFYIESTANRWDPDQKENYYYRRFVPEDYLPKEYLDIPLEDERGENWHNGSSNVGWHGFWKNAPKLKEDVELPEADPWRTVPEKFDFYSKYPDLYVVRRVGESCLPDIRVKPATIENLFSLSEPGNGARDVLAGNVLIYGPAGTSLGVAGWAKTNPQSELLAGSEWVLRNTTTGEETRIVDSTEPLPPRPWENVSRWDLTNEQERDIRAWEMLDVDPTPGVIMLNNSQFDDGEYELTEVVAPNRYMLLTRPIKFTVDNSNVDTWFSTLGEIVNIKPGMLHWRKVDEQGNPLPGSVWKIVNTDSGEEYVVEDDSSGNIFKEDLVSEIGNDVLAQPGNIDVPLPPGKYTVQEIQAPEGYMVDSTIRTAVLDASTGTAEGVYEDYLGELVNKRIPTVTVTTTETPAPTTVTEVPPTVTTTLPPETVTTTATPPVETVSTTETVVLTPPTSTVTLPPETRVVTTTETTENTVTTTQTPPPVTTTETTENTVTTTQTPPPVTTTETTENTVTTTQIPPPVTTTETTENTVTTTETTENTVTTTQTPLPVTTTETTENTVTTTQTPPPVTTTEITENTVTTTQTPPAVTMTETTENTVTTTETTENTVTTTQIPPATTTTETVTEPAVTITETNDCDCTPVTVTETPEPVTETVTQPSPSTTVENGVEIVQLPPTTVTETETAPEPTDEHASSDTPDQPERERSGLLASTGANTVGIVVFSGLMLALGGIFVTRRKK